MSMLLRKCGLTLVLLLSALLFNICYAEDALPKFTCTLTDKLLADEKPGAATDTFTKSTPVIYLICQSDEVKKGQAIKSVWVAANTHNAAPDNYKIDEKTIDVTSDLEPDQVFTGNFSISSPTAGWPIGDYHVDLYVGDKLSESVKFSVK